MLIWFKKWTESFKFMAISVYWFCSTNANRKDLLSTRTLFWWTIQIKIDFSIKKKEVKFSGVPILATNKSLWNQRHLEIERISTLSTAFLPSLALIHDDANEWMCGNAKQIEWIVLMIRSKSMMAICSVGWVSEWVCDFCFNLSLVAVVTVKMRSINCTVAASLGMLNHHDFTWFVGTNSFT